MKVAVTGASGLVGSALVPSLASAGHEVLRLVRREARSKDEIPWDPERGETDSARLEGVQAVVHLAGENLAEGRWTQAKKRRLRTSRVAPTRLLARTLAHLGTRPSVLVSASAIGYYGDRGEVWLDEADAPSDDFLGRLCVDWEDATAPAAAAGVRVVLLRSGVVLSPNGGALRKLLLPFRLGLGGPLSTGSQYMSWIAIDDLVGVIGHALGRGALVGPLNAVSPAPATNAEFTRILGRVLGRPTVARVPAFALRLAVGEMADAALLASTRVRPARLLESGYRFRYPDLEGALRHLLGRKA
jgi:uncharacterized protein (TIGR01777 family)